MQLLINEYWFFSLVSGNIVSINVSSFLGHAWLLSYEVLRTCICIIITFLLTFFWLKELLPFFTQNISSRSLYRAELVKFKWDYTQTTNMYINSCLLPLKIHILLHISSGSLLKELFYTFWLRIFNHNVCMWNFFYVLNGNSVILCMLAFYHVHIHISVWQFDWWNILKE